jgi:Cdc6-like AAA superfamily ATPase
MATDLNDCKLIEINALDTRGGIKAEYVNINNTYDPFAIVWKLVHQLVQTVAPEFGGSPKEVDVFIIKLCNDEAEDIAFDITSFYGK